MSLLQRIKTLWIISGWTLEETEKLKQNKKPKMATIIRLSDPIEELLKNE